VESSARRFGWASPTTALILGAVALLLYVAGIALSIAAHQFDGGLSAIPTMAPFAVVGFIVARRQPNNPIGWIMLWLYLLYVLGADAGSYGVIAFRLGHPDLPFARLAVVLTVLWISLPALLPLPILLFPDGRLPSRRWRISLWVYIVVCLTLFIGAASTSVQALTVKHVQVDSSGELAKLGNKSADPLGAILFLAFFVISLSWVVGKVIAYRRATGERRQQLKWLMSSGAIAIIGFTCALLFNNSSVVILRALRFGFIGIIAVPVALGVGILKYRLYEIDRVISRTLSYAIVTGLLVGVYVGMVTLSTRALPLSSPVGVAASTLAAVALFTPLRRRVQRLVDHRFNRTRYDAEATAAAFSSTLRDTLELSRVQGELVAVVQRSIQPSHISLWIRPR
jgi:hypothetical protein